MVQQALDTVYVQAPRDALSVAADWALVVVAAAIAVATIAALFLMFRTSRSLSRWGRTASKKADPLFERSRSVAANVEFITGTLRTDIEGLHRSVRALSERLQQASDHMEVRIDEFNALMEVVQGEAEDVFLDTASTARGVRAGARRLVRPSERDDALSSARRSSPSRVDGAPPEPTPVPAAPDATGEA